MSCKYVGCKAVLAWAGVYGTNQALREYIVG